MATKVFGALLALQVVLALAGHGITKKFIDPIVRKSKRNVIEPIRRASDKNIIKPAGRKIINPIRSISTKNIIRFIERNHAMKKAHRDVNSVIKKAVKVSNEVGKGAERSSRTSKQFIRRSNRELVDPIGKNKAVKSVTRRMDKAMKESRAVVKKARRLSFKQSRRLRKNAKQVGGQIDAATTATAKRLSKAVKRRNGATKKEKFVWTATGISAWGAFTGKKRALPQRGDIFTGQDLSTMQAINPDMTPARLERVGWIYKKDKFVWTATGISAWGAFMGKKRAPERGDIFTGHDLSTMQSINADMTPARLERVGWIYEKATSPMASTRRRPRNPGNKFVRCPIN